MAKDINIWRKDLVDEMEELIRLGVNVPKGAIKQAEKADPKDFESMSDSDVVEYLIFMSMGVTHD